MSRRELLALYSDQVLPIVILLIAIFLRLHNLDTIPSGLLWDESWNGLDTVAVLNGERPIFFTENFGREPIFIYLQAISVAVLGQTTLALRAVSAVLGILTVVVAYLLARRMFDARVALLTSGWLTLSLWHVIFSRMGLRTISLPLFLAVGFYCLWRGLEEGARHASPVPTIANSPRPVIWFALGGIVMGLSLYTYSTARFAPFVIVALALYVALLHRRLLRQVLPGLVLALILTTLIFLPEGLYFLSNPASFLDRAQEVTIVNPALQKGDLGQTLLDSASHTLGMFATRGDSNWGRNLPGWPIFDPLSAILMVFGIALAIRRFRQPAYGLILIWLAVMIIPGLIATKETPNYLRVTGIIPAVFILPALAAGWLWEVWETHAPAVLRALPVLLVMLALLGGSIHVYHSYFGLWAKLTVALQSFGADRFFAVGIARDIASAEGKLVFVTGDQHEYPGMRYILSGQPESQYIQIFDDEKSVIFPADGATASYLFTKTPPQAHILREFFDQSSTQVVGTAPSGRPITLHRLLNPRPPFEPQWPVPARFGDQIVTEGFDLPKDGRAGEAIAVRWYWRIISTEQRVLAFTNQLFGEDGRRSGQADDLGFSPGHWPIGTSGISTFVVNIDPEAPTGAYWLHVAMYERRSQGISNLHVFDEQGNQAGNRLLLGPIKIHGRPTAQASEGPVSSPSVPDNLLPASFTDQIDLLGYNLSDRQLASGESLDLTLFWSPRGRPTHDYTVFVHLLDSSGQLRGQADSPPMAGKYPTSVWDAGEVIADSHTLSLAPDLPAGEYRIAIGLYDPETGQRVPIVDEDSQVSGDHVIIYGLALDE